MNEEHFMPNTGRCDFVHHATGMPCQFGGNEQLFAIEHWTRCAWHLPQVCKEQWSLEERRSFRRQLDAYLDACEGQKRCAQLAGVVFCDNNFADRTLYGADFQGAHFPEPAYFQRTRFLSRAIFFNARFEKDAVFESARFVEGACFNGTRFRGPATFAYGSSDALLEAGHAVTVTPSYSWRDVVFFESASFAGRHFQGPVDFSNALFGLAPDFKSCTFAASVLFPPKSCFMDQHSEHASAAYRVLALAAVQFNWSTAYQSMFRALEANSLHDATRSTSEG